MAGPGFLEHLHPPRLPEGRIRVGHTFCLGGVAFLLFLALAGSGLLLMFHYTPTPTGAADFFAQEAGDLPFAWFFRRVHYLAGQGMVLAVLLHMARVLATGAHLPPRAANWLVGLGLLALTLAMDLSGYVLRWDGATRAAAAVVAGLLAEIPLVGEMLRGVLLGGPELGPAALLRFYVLHCLALPLLCLGLALYHFWRIRRDGRAIGGL
ncbi:Cytochrome b/b6 domain protein [Desulfarculus baarsii DSM 2075]|uniref:Cytochrome b/b6 domain protein n=1 Tax=Desulfarculus baarsii (strain ATCC 33931 / DSM 2075 / LMG 7858 / VKM B-1802 / 2st14) TaxID=644282 RepID=E1QHS8_DESB2|nr:cytochrome b N-terminal domain-containing protein [Desulfarculus baarsii]ADK85121.1 Cytochrome b/b6 domain protein [Desulfarculus baarsii DSM 2075]